MLWCQALATLVVLAGYNLAHQRLFLAPMAVPRPAQEA